MTKHDEVFTKIVLKMMTDVRDLAEWGLEHGHTSPEHLRLTVAARREVVPKLIESGMSQRQAAKALGVHHSTIQDDLAEKPPKNGGKSATPKARAEPAPDSATVNELHHELGDFCEGYARKLTTFLDAHPDLDPMAVGSLKSAIYAAVETLNHLTEKLQ